MSTSEHAPVTIRFELDGKRVEKEVHGSYAEFCRQMLQHPELDAKYLPILEEFLRWLFQYPELAVTRARGEIILNINVPNRSTHQRELQGYFKFTESQL